MTAGIPLRSSQPVYNRLAATYEEHFQLPHRKMYDELAWEISVALLPPISAAARSVVVDAGCGTGRWARGLIDLGCHVVGLEPASGMIAQLKDHPPGPGFEHIEAAMETVTRHQLFTAAGIDSDAPDVGVDLVIAMGSMQYTPDPVEMIKKFASWLRSGGAVAMLVDSLVALILELISTGRFDEAQERLKSRRGTWRIAGQEADLHLLDKETMVAGCKAAGLVDIEAHGLLVGATALGRETFIRDAAEHYQAMAARQRGWAEDPLLADAGKQLLITARRPQGCS
jgi:SAM-dependent methyltransferase